MSDKKREITIKYDFGDIVYLKTDIEQLPRMITGFILRQKSISYYCSCGTIESAHYDYELTSERITDFY
jgi:hypothetical protein